MYYYVLSVIGGRFTQQMITGAGSVRIIDSDLKLLHRERMANTVAVSRRAASLLNTESVAGITIRKVAGQIRIGEVERLILAEVSLER